MAKKDVILLVIIATYIVAMVAMFFGVDKYIEAKDKRLYREVRRKVRDVFVQDEYVDVVYLGSITGYEQIKVPKRPELNIKEDEEDEEAIKREVEYYNWKKRGWDESYGNLSRLYRLISESGPYIRNDKWELVTIKFDYNCVCETWTFPYAVGYFKQPYSWGHDYSPSIKSAVDEAFEFFTKNEKSWFFEKYRKGVP